MDFTKEINAYYDREKAAIDRLDRKELNAAMNALLEAYERGATIYVFGNGGSSATASHMVCDFDKGTCYDLPKKFHFVCLNDNIPVMMAIANDDSFENVFVYQLEDRLKKDDLVLAISGSGNSHNVIKAIDYAKKVGCKIIGMTGYDGGKLAKAADYQLHVPADDMQITEDLHMGFDHMIMQIFWKYLAAKNGQQAIYKINK
ncbi:MAG: Phosphoheptose isomerase 1 [Tenericutes bacterium ADurb.BinA155]|jgi:D-sedoheptulose 7-phosphate isomerase|nr:MAG: Phosphoheptose isomerase 1 [Tenericutes bacterium ADurb.BinA155]